MSPAAQRRRIDWHVILDGTLPNPRLVDSPTPVQPLAALTAEVMGSPSAAALDRLLRASVEFAREAIQLERTAIFLVDRKGDCMVGSWGTDAQGQTVDEHELTFDRRPTAEEVFERARAGIPFSVYDGCPHIAQVDGETRIIGHGWSACTPIIADNEPLGILFNDTALSKTPIDESKQWRAVMLCSLIARPLLRNRNLLLDQGERPTAPNVLVRTVTQMLASDPTLNCDELAKQFQISSGRLARTFKREAKSSIVDYRNDLRLARFLERVDSQAGNLLQAALDAGFGSYAQFHRVFRARFGRTPRDYLLERNNGEVRPAS
ncbi:MAG TPA: helix-turn-helix domain-containing protein [Polyangiaceae bacterium]|jgi:AraC-like DNA-binding protein|nr:helix-turn-helix domain-containing protein [Polyangiaceae bacterium]